MLLRWLPAAIALAAGCSDKPNPSAHVTSRLTAKPPAPPAATATVSGSVIERDTGDPVADAQVVLRGDHSEVTATTHGDGTFTLMAPRGTYRAFVRDARVISVGLAGRARVRGSARAELAGVPDEALMSIVEIDGDIKALELPVILAGVFEGTVWGTNNLPTAGVTVAAVPVEDPVAPPRPGTGVFLLPRGLRPVLGTDTAISDASGAFKLHVPPGRYLISATGAAYGGMADLGPREVNAGQSEHLNVSMLEGCVISGKVIGPSGAAAHDGAMEVSIDGARFSPTGRIHADGTFRWAAISEARVDLRAWPWESAPSPIRSFDCAYGKRYPNVVLRTGNETPDLAGMIVDASGSAVPLGFLDITPLDRGVDGQQERADASGHFEVYELPAGRFEITASSPGRGMVSTMVVAPRSDVVLMLCGTGRIVGTTDDLVDGSFELVFDHCGGASSFVELDEEPRLVVVRGGRFTVENVPACALTYTARWRDKVIPSAVVVEPRSTAYIELALGTPTRKLVRGIVRDPQGAPAANARISALVDNDEVTSVRAGSDGTFQLEVPGGAELVASNGKRVGRGTVGRANVKTEDVEIVLDERAGVP